MADIKASDILTLAHFALDEGWGYIWGGAGGIHTQAAQNKATRAQTKKWGQRWVGKHVLDCSGVFYWSYRKSGGYMPHGCNKIFNAYSVSKGKLKNGVPTDGTELPPGCAVFLLSGNDRHHMGMYIGGGMVIEAKGTYYGVVKSSVKVWDEWAILKNTEYDVTEETASGFGRTGTTPTSKAASSTKTGGTASLSVPYVRSGNTGDHVIALQRLLTASGFECDVSGTADEKTIEAVKAYQADHGLSVDGVTGTDTWSKLIGIK